MPDHSNDIKLTEDQVTVLKSEIAALEESGADNDRLSVLRGHLRDTETRLARLKAAHEPAEPAAAEVNAEAPVRRSRKKE
jgi:hypothetical protein